MNTHEKLEFLKAETEELHAMQVGMNAVLSALIATHPDREALMRQVLAHRAVIAKGELPHVDVASVRDLALKTIDWLTLDTPPKI